MSKGDIKLPILVKYNEKLLRLMEIVYSADNSIYFVFPRKQGYVLDRGSEKKFYKGPSAIVDREFKDICKKYKDPKISFHPGKNVIHINSFSNHVKNDYEILNIAPNGLMLCFLCQFVFPTEYKIFDEYKKQFHNDTDLILNDNSGSSNKNFDLDYSNISLEVYIHSPNITITEDTILPCARVFKYFTTFTNINGYSITLCVSQLLKHDETTNNDVLININTKDKSLMYMIKPIQ